jgi:hypothetical protein
MTTGTPRDAAIPDWKLERHLLDELWPEDRAAMQAALQDEAVRLRLAALERSTADLLHRHPPGRVAAAVRELAGREDRPRPLATPRRSALGVALCAALLGALAVLVPRPTEDPPVADVTRGKGLAPHLLLYRKARASDLERLEAGGLARQHDIIQLAYHAAGRPHGVIVSLDGNGLVTRHLPATGAQAAPLEAGAVALPTAYELDDAPGFERFFLVTAAQPFPVETVVDAVRRQHRLAPPGGMAAGRLDLPDMMDQYSLLLRKEPSP